MTAANEHYHREVATISPGASVRDAADALKAQAVGALVVVGEDGPVGIVTDRDLLKRVIAEGRDAGATSVREVMSEPLHVATPDDSLDRVVGMMSTQGIRRVPVVRGDEVIGIVALDDVVAEVSQELDDLAKGARRGLHSVQRSARARELASDLGERVRDLGGHIEHLGTEAKESLAREVENLRERIRARKR